MDFRAHLIEGFEYDLWANLRWIEALPRLQRSQEAAEVMRHIIDAQRRWLERCADPETVPDAREDLAEAATSISEAWREFLRICDPAAFVSYTTMAGDSHFDELGDIARHVINHGSYHRGQLRGLAMAEGLDHFPETDFIRYVRGRAAKR